MNPDAAKREWEALLWLCRLPFVGAQEVALLLELSDRDADRLLARLAGLGWLDPITPSSPELEEDRLYALSQEAIPHLAGRLGIPATDLRELYPVGQYDITQRLLRLETTVGFNQFAARLVSDSRSGDEVELTNIRSLPRRHGEAWWPPGVEGYGCLRSGSHCAPFFIACDRVGAPAVHRRKLVSAWYAFRGANHHWDEDSFPSILVLPPDETELKQWAQAVTAVADRRGASPLPVLLAETGAASSYGPLAPIWRFAGGTVQLSLPDRLVWRDSIPMASRAPATVARGEPPEAITKKGPSLRTRLSQVLDVSQKGASLSGLADRIAAMSALSNAIEKRILEWLGHHPLLSADDLAVILRAQIIQIQQLLDRLERHGLVGYITRSLDRETSESFYFLADLGARLMAARDGVPPRRYARYGTVASMMESPHGNGRLKTLQRQIEHTVGANRFFVSLAAEGFRSGARLVRWLSPTESSVRFKFENASHWLRPDGAGGIHWEGATRSFYLEWDRGTMRWPQMIKKCRLYTAYYASLARAGVPEESRPVLLVVTNTPQREIGLSKAIRETFEAISQPVASVLTSNAPLVERYGPLGSVWQSPDKSHRRSWP